MRVCLIAYRGNPYSGGQGIYLYFLSRELARLGHQVDVIVGPPYPRPLEGWATVHRVPNLNLWGRQRGDWLHRENPFALFQPWHLFDFAATRLGFFPEPLSFSFRALRVLAGLLRTRRFDLVHDVQTLGYGTLAMREFGMPVVTTVHHPLSIDRRESFQTDGTFEEMYHTAVFFPVHMQGFVIRRMTHVITASQAGREAIAQDFRVKNARISVVPNGVDTDFFHNPGNIRRAANRLLFVGNTDDPKKGVVQLLETMRRLPPQVTLRIVDAGFPDKVLMPRQVARMKLEGRVTFTGKLSEQELREEYCRCTLLVQPSLYEGFGLPAAEAAACATPVVATRVGAVGEVVTPETGVLVPPARPEKMRRAIMELLGAPARRRAMGRAGRARMVEVFSWPRAARNTVAVYERVLAGAGRGRGAP